MEIESHPFFEKISSDQRQELIRNAIIEEYDPDTIIFDEGSRSDGMYLVLEGTVAFSKKTPENTFRTVSYSTLGDFFGEIGLFTGETRSLKAESRGNVKLAKIPSDYLLSFFKSTQGPIDNILQSIVLHLHDPTLYR
jgi:CRP-like cAMP-binding protein